MVDEPGYPPQRPGLPGPAADAEVLGARRVSSAAGMVLSLAVISAASLTAVAFSATAPLIRLTFGLTEVGVGAIASSIYAGAAASSVAAGRLTDSLGPGVVMALATLTLAAGAAVALLGPTTWMFFAGVVVAGLGYGAVNPPTNVLANPRNARMRGLAMSVKQSGVPFGGIVAGLVLPSLASRVGWRPALLVPVVTCAALAALSLRLRLRLRRPPASRAADGHDQPSAIMRLRLPRAFAFGFLMAGVQVTIFTFLAVYLVDGHGLSAGRAGAALAVLLGGGLVGRPAWGWLSDRWHADRLRVLQVSALLSGVFLAILPHVAGAALPVVLAAIGLCSVGWNGVYVATVAEAVEPALVGSATGRSLFHVNVGAVVLPPVVGLVAGHGTHWPAAWALCAGLSLVSAVVLQLSRVPAAALPAHRKGSPC